MQDQRPWQLPVGLLQPRRGQREPYGVGRAYRVWINMQRERGDQDHNFHVLVQKGKPLCWG